MNFEWIFIIKDFCGLSLYVIF